MQYAGSHEQRWAALINCLWLRSQFMREVFRNVTLNGFLLGPVYSYLSCFENKSGLSMAKLTIQ